jgi:hypothetical protein
MLKPVGWKICGVALVRRISSLECVRGLLSVVWRHVGDWAISYGCDRDV